MDKRLVTAIVLGVILLHAIEQRGYDAPHIRWEPPNLRVRDSSTPAASGTHWVSATAGTPTESLQRISS